MSKTITKNSKATTTKNLDHQSATQPPQTHPTAKVPPLLTVKPGLKYEGSRAAWYGALLKCEGKSEEAFIEACTKNPPALPKSGKAEKPQGWLRYFIREGVASLK